MKRLVIVFARAGAWLRGKFSLPLVWPGALMVSSVALISAVLFVLGGEQLSPHAIFGYLAAIILIGLKFGSVLALASAWLSAGVGGFVFYHDRQPRLAPQHRGLSRGDDCYQRCLQPGPRERTLA